jgi:hypothetical protein
MTIKDFLETLPEGRREEMMDFLRGTIPCTFMLHIEHQDTQSAPTPSLSSQVAERVA